MDKEKRNRLYGDPDKVIQYMDYSDNPPKDNSYVLDLVPGVLQPLEVDEIMEEDPIADKLLSNLDIELIVKNAEQQYEKQMKRFLEPSKSESLTEITKKQYAPSIKRKAYWAARIFDQWKCIWNYKVKQKLDHSECELIQGTLLNMEINRLSEVLSFFLPEIRKQSGDKYPRETLYKIVLSIPTLYGYEWKRSEIAWSSWSGSNA